ncbi:MAG: hypothetical protein P8I92_06735 [Schleiferiaceae bacterium]|nr:hypothetical protein [Schleiferiaceae bacterium]
MKFKFSFFTALSFACLIVSGQNPKALRSSFDFVQPPQSMLSKDFKYSSSGSVTYEEEIKIEKEENDYALEEWNSLKMNQKLKIKAVDGSNLPYNKYFPTIHSSARLTSFVSIEGLDKSESANASVNIIINRPICSSSSRKIRFVRDGNTITRFRADMTTSISIEAIITDDEGHIENKNYTGVYNITDPEEFTGKMLGGGISSAALGKVEKRNFQASEKMALENALKDLSKYLSMKYGFVTINNYNTEIWTFRTTKKNNYDNINSASQSLVGAYRLGIDSDMREQFETKLISAIDVWKEEYGNYAPNDKKARIGSVQAGLLLLNIAEAYLWMQDFSKCSQALGDFDSILSMNKKLGRNMAAMNHFRRLENIQRDLQSRYSTLKE